MPEQSTWGTRLGSRYDTRFGRGLLSTSIKHGAMEAVGWNIEGFGHKAKNMGFLGWKRGVADYEKYQTKGLSKVASASRVGMGTAMRALPVLFTAYSAYQGYQQNGVAGAIGGVAEMAAWGAAFHYGAGVIGTATGVVGGVALAGAGLGYGAYQLGKAGKAYEKGLRQLEMGNQDQIQNAVTSAGAATMRQRSLMALNNTHVNGRMAIGNEGFLTHRSFGG